MHSVTKGVCQIKLFRGKINVMEETVNKWIEEFHINFPGKECEVSEIHFIPNGTRNECDIMIRYLLQDCCVPENKT